MELGKRLLVFCFFFLLIHISSNSLTPVSSQAFKTCSLPKEVGTLSVKINQLQFSAKLTAEIKPYSYEVSAGNKDHEIRIEWKYISTPAEIKPGTITLGENYSDIVTEYINFTASVNYVTSYGYLIVRDNDGKKITGEFSFAAAEKGFTASSTNEQRLTDGIFEINYGNN